MQVTHHINIFQMIHKVRQQLTDNFRATTANSTHKKIAMTIIVAAVDVLHNSTQYFDALHIIVVDGLMKGIDAIVL